jgi:sodium transport system permease protein
MSRRNIAIVYCKELRDSLRDRRTLVSMIVVPVLAMPVLMVGMTALTTKMVNRAQAEVPKVMVVGGEDSPGIMAALREAKAIRIVPPCADFTAAILEKRIRAAVQIPPGFDAAVARGAAAKVCIYGHAGEIKSGFASNHLEQFFRNLRDTKVRERLQERHVPQQVLTPFEIVRQNVASPAQVGGSVLGGIIPYLIIVLCMTGAMYPAIDLTAGEKERGTMETILCSPVSRTHLVLGKFFMVLTASLATVLFSLASMSASFLCTKRPLLGGQLRHAGELKLTLDPAGVAGVFLMLLPVAVLLSAALLAIALFARSFKEAQSYIGPLMILIIMPAMAGLLPGLELSARLALVPLVNVSLVCKEMTAGTWHWNYILLILGSSCIYAAAALAFAVWLFHREEVLFRA